MRLMLHLMHYGVIMLVPPALASFDLHAWSVQAYLLRIGWLVGGFWLLGVILKGLASFWLLHSFQHAH